MYFRTLGDCGGILLLGDGAFLQHLPENSLLLLHTELIIGYRIIIVRRIACTYYHRSLREIDTLSVNAEIILCRTFNAVTAVAVIAAVAVELHDIRFCVFLLELESNQDL